MLTERQFDRLLCPSHLFSDFLQLLLVLGNQLLPTRLDFFQLLAEQSDL